MVGDAMGSSSASSGGTSAMTGAMGGGAGMALMGVNMLMAQSQKKKLKKLQQMERENATRHHNYTLGELQNEKLNIEHNGEMNEAGNYGNANDRDVFSSSIPMGNQKELDWQKNQRVSSVNRRIDLENADWANGERIQLYQEKLKRNQELMSLINSLAGNGLGGAMSSFGATGGSSNG